MDSLSLLQGIFPSQGSNAGLPRCRRILYQLSHKGSPRILEWVAYLFARGFSRSRNQTRVSRIAGGFFTNWAIREVLTLHMLKDIFNIWLFPVSDNMNKAAINIHVQVFMWSPVLWDSCSETQMLGCIVVACLVFRETAKLVFRVAVPFISTSNVLSNLLSLHSCQHLVLSLFFNFSHSIR